MKQLDDNLIRNLVQTAIKQIDVCNKFKKPRLLEIQKSEDMYLNKVKKQLKNRFNIPIPILSGFVDHLKSKIDDAPKISFNRAEEADYKAAKKVTAMWERDSGDDRGAWGFVDRQVKFLAIFSGRGVFNYCADSTNGYNSNLDWVDYYDFIFEPQGGANLDKHLFCGQESIFVSKNELVEGSKTGLYRRDGIIDLIKGVSEHKEAGADKDERFNRYRGLGLDPVTNNYTGEQIFSLTRLETQYNGKRYYLLFDPITRAAVRVQELRDVFSCDEWSYASWATHEDPMNFFSKAPVDDVYPIGEAMKLLVNETFNNIQKRNWGMRAYDPSMFPDPEKLRWKMDGLVKVKATNGKSINQGIYSFETPDNSSVTINMIEYFDNFLGTKSGVPPSAQGASDKDAKVGIYYGDMQQVADRLGLYNKAYRECWAKLGKRYITGLRDHLSGVEAVRIIGNAGAEWEELRSEEIRDFNIQVSGGDLEEQADEVKKKKKSEALAALVNNQALSTKLNQEWLVETILRNGEFGEDEIRQAMNTESGGDAELLSEASQAIQDIIQNKKPELNRGATTAYMQKIIDFAYDKLGPKDMDKYEQLIGYAMAHIDIARENMMRKAKVSSLVNGQAPTPPPTPAMGAPMNMANNSMPANTAGATAQRSAVLSGMSR